MRLWTKRIGCDWQGDAVVACGAMREPTGFRWWMAGLEKTNTGWPRNTWRKQKSAKGGFSSWWDVPKPCVGCEWPSPFGMEETDALCEQLLFSHRGAGLGACNHQAQWASSISCANHSQRS